MDLIYTNAQRSDQGVLLAYGFDLSFGKSENDFEIVLAEDDPILEYGSVVYIEGTEYGGIVDAIKTDTDGNTMTYYGRTWHGLLNSKVITPDAGANYFIASGDANEILSTLIARLGLSDLFTATIDASGINISKYQFKRFCKGYEGILDMLADNGAKLKISWEDRSVKLSAVPIADYTDSPIDGDVASLKVEHHEKTVNHLICLGSGELSAREVVHLYVDQLGTIGSTQFYTGLDEYTDTYDYSNAESSEDLLTNGKKRLKELRNADTADISVLENSGLTFDIGDIIGAKEQRSGISATATVTQKIVKINNGAIRINYKTGG